VLGDLKFVLQACSNPCLTKVGSTDGGLLNFTSVNKKLHNKEKPEI